mmetsp:Transcript_8096/g.16298  ORF Transcript_8096/g.16298 Transcript_8096/m.16298 type:complete len:104 (-) Transcript_8096:1987-2298(-)
MSDCGRTSAPCDEENWVAVWKTANDILFRPATRAIREADVVEQRVRDFPFEMEEVVVHAVVTHAPFLRGQVPRPPQSPVEKRRRSESEPFDGEAMRPSRKKKG